jgi:hypothetical protein
LPLRDGREGRAADLGSTIQSTGLGMGLESRSVERKSGEVGSKVFWLVPSSASDLIILMDLFLKLARDSTRVILVRQFFLTLLLMCLQKFLVKLLPTI